MNVYLLPGTQEAMLELAHRLNASIGAVRTSFLLDYLDLRGLCEVNHGSELPGEHLNRALSGVLLVPIPLYPFILPLIFTEAQGRIPAHARLSSLHFIPVPF